MTRDEAFERQAGPELADFAGDWVIARQVEDRLAGQQAVFEGLARLTPDGAGLHWHETGLLRLPGQPPVRAERRYLWRAAAGTHGGIEVLFEDGRPFHAFVPGRQESARHDCAPDLYQVRYDFAGWPRWQAVWQVTGPRKDYVMTSRYARPEVSGASGASSGPPPR